MTEKDRRRAFVSDLYAGLKWKKRVAKMSDDRITAIYLRHLADSHITTSEENLEETLRLELPPISGPHANEDEFPII